MTTRLQAARSGLIIYKPAKPCRRCGTSARYTSCGNCVECHRKLSEDYRGKIADAMRKARKKPAGR